MLCGLHRQMQVHIKLRRKSHTNAIMTTSMKMQEAVTTAGGQRGTDLSVVF